MKIAVTAASGKLGAEIVKALLALDQDLEVVALARTPKKAEYLGVEVRPGDYNDRAMLENSLKGVDAVLLVSGMDAPEKRIEQHRNVIEAAKTSGVKKIVYTSVQGAEKDTAFSPIIQSNRQTEKDVQNSGLDWVIGRNGIYIEPDLEYIETYIKENGINNCAGDGKCGYTTRPELGYAYAKMLTEDQHNSKVYNLHGESLTQYQLAEYLSKAFNVELTYKPMTVEEYKAERTAALGDFLGTVISGIYEGILNGESDNESNFEEAAGRKHKSWDEYFSDLKK